MESSTTPVETDVVDVVAAFWLVPVLTVDVLPVEEVSDVCVEAEESVAADETVELLLSELVPEDVDAVTVLVVPYPTRSFA
jgi:hypothetical protein